MTIEHLTDTFYQKPVIDYGYGDNIDPLANGVYRLALDYDDTEDMVTLLQSFLAKVDKSSLDALIIGEWKDPYESSAQAIIDQLIAEKDSLPALKALFIGDMTYEQCEISWIIQGSYKALLDAYPQLEVLRIRGSSGLVLEPVHHDHLQQLIIECGGLPADIIRHLSQSTLPALQHLELWLGTEDYGFNGDITLCEQLLAAINPSRLHYLGLRDSEISDALANYIAQQPWLAQLHTLDLSLGTFGDIGAQALLASPYITQLKCLDVSHHYMSDEVMARLLALPIAVTANDQKDEDERYVAVGE